MLPRFRCQAPLYHTHRAGLGCTGSASTNGDEAREGGGKACKGVWLGTVVEGLKGGGEGEVERESALVVLCESEVINQQKDWKSKYGIVCEMID